MSLFDSFIGPILGGLIAGLVGLFISRYESSQARGEHHLHEHQDNFKIIEEALTSYANKNVWVLGFSPAALGFCLPHWDKDPSTSFNKYSILNYYSFSEGKNPSIDKTLYADIPKHFPSLGMCLQEVENSLNNNRVWLDQTVFRLSNFIYAELTKSDLEVVSLDNRTSRHKLNELNEGSGHLQKYAGWIFLLMIREDEKEWFGEYQKLESAGIIEGLKEHAELLRNKFGPEKIDKMTDTVRATYAKIRNCYNMLEELSHKKKLKGKCEYI